MEPLWFTTCQHVLKIIAPLEFNTWMAGYIKTSTSTLFSKYIMLNLHKYIMLYLSLFATHYITICLYHNILYITILCYMPISQYNLYHYIVLYAITMCYHYYHASFPWIPLLYCSFSGIHTPNGKNLSILVKRWGVNQ